MEIRDWREMVSWSGRLLKERTGNDVNEWIRRIQEIGFVDEQSLRLWLTEQGVVSYPQSLLVWERFGYPQHLLASAEQLIDAQYADRPHLRPILDAILGAAAGLGEVVVQARKGYVSLVTPLRTFARVQPTTKSRVDLALRLAGEKPGGRLLPSKLHETTNLQISFTRREEVDAEALEWLQRAYDQNR